MIPEFLLQRSGLKQVMLKPHGFAHATVLPTLLCCNMALRHCSNPAFGVTEPQKAPYARAGVKRGILTGELFEFETRTKFQVAVVSGPKSLLFCKE